MEIDEAKLIESLREIMDQREVKLTELSTLTGIPYRSLQNYFGNRSRIPATAYLQICHALAVAPEYPVLGRFKLDSRALKQAITDVFGAHLLSICKDGDLMDAPASKASDAQAMQQAAGMIATLVAGRYDLALERELQEPLNAG